MAAEDQTLIGKSKLLYCVRQVCTGVEIRTKRTAKCPLVLKCMMSGGEEGFSDEAFADKDIRKPTPLPRTKARGREKLAGWWEWPHCSHDWAALGLLFLEGGREQVGAARQVEEAFREAAVWAGLGQRLKLVDAGQSCRAENAVDALLWREGWALQVRLSPQLLGHGWTLGQRQKRSWIFVLSWMFSNVSDVGCIIKTKPQTTLFISSSYQNSYYVLFLLDWNKDLQPLPDVFILT